jgi:hypothetical protein
VSYATIKQGSTSIAATMFDTQLPRHFVKEYVKLIVGSGLRGQTLHQRTYAHLERSGKGSVSVHKKTFTTPKNETSNLRLVDCPHLRAGTK